jgi:hypothetical protein
VSEESPQPIALPPELVDFVRQEAQLLGLRMSALRENGFTREEALQIILAAVPTHAPVFMPPRSGP